MDARPVMVYDGDCAVCSRFVRAVVWLAKPERIWVTDFNSQWFSETLGSDTASDSVLFVTNGDVVTKSRAVIHILTTANPALVGVHLFRLIPRTWLDAHYDRVARNRHRLMRGASCDIPGKKFKSMYLA